MCESRAVLVKGSSETTVLEDVVYLEPIDGGVRLRNIEGKTLELKNVRIRGIDFLKHMIYLEEAGS